MTAARDAELLAVVACSGERCRAVRALHGGDAGTPADLRAAVAGRPHAALVSAGCLGPCHLASLVAVGPATFTEAGQLCFTRRPATVALAERADRASALVEWIGHGDPEVVPRSLRGSGLPDRPDTEDGRG